MVPKYTELNGIRVKKKDKHALLKDIKEEAWTISSDGLFQERGVSQYNEL